MAKTFGFLSYARTDAEHVLGIAKKLREAGAPLWLNKLDIAAGDHWDRAVEHALETCDCLVVMLSPAAVGSENVMDEVAYAIDKGKRIVPVLLQSCEIPLRLRRRQYIDLTRGDSAALHAIAAAISAPSEVPKKITPESHAVWQSEVSLTVENPYLFATDFVMTDADLRQLSTWQAKHGIEHLIVTVPAKANVSLPPGVDGIYPMWPPLPPRNTYWEILCDLAIVSGGCAFDTGSCSELRFQEDPSYVERVIDGLIQLSPTVPSVLDLGRFQRVVLDPSGVTFTGFAGALESRSVRSQLLLRSPCDAPEEIKMFARRLTLLNPDVRFEEHVEQLTTRSSDLRVEPKRSEGVAIPYGLASAYFVNEALEAVWRSQCYCLLSNSTITQSVLQRVLAIAVTCEEPLVVFTTGLSHTALVFSVMNKLRGTVVCAAIICPEPELKRISAYLGTDFPNIDNVRTPSDLQSLPWVTVTASPWGESVIERSTRSPKKRPNLSATRRHRGGG